MRQQITRRLPIPHGLIPLHHSRLEVNVRQLHVGILLFTCLLSWGAGNPNQVTIPRHPFVDITMGELLIRVTPEAEADARQLNAKSTIHKFHAQMGIQSFSRVFTHIARPETNSNLERIYLLRFPLDTDLNRLKDIYTSHPFIEAAEFNFLRHTLASELVPNDPRYEEQWNLPFISMPKAWTIEKGKPDVIIAIVDGGIDYTHEDLAGKIWRNVGEIPNNEIDDDGNGYIDDVRGWDFTDAPSTAAQGDYLNGDEDPSDESGHGTHVAGIAGASVSNEIGIAGVAWKCTLMPARAGASTEYGTILQDDDSSAAIVYATDNGAKIINMSWGSPRNSFVIRDAIDYAYGRGVVLVAAAGNGRTQESSFPAGYPKVISVASTEQNRRRFYQSNFGASIDIGAPGNLILSTHINDRYRLLTGTSMAAPHVSGVAALVLSKRPSLTHEEVRQRIISTVDPIIQSPELVDAGNLNAWKALLASALLQSRIFSPKTDSGRLHQIEIVGSAHGFRFDTWQLMYGLSTTPKVWTTIHQPSSDSKANETLSFWNASILPEGIYTLRLEVSANNGRIVRDEVVVSIDRTPPHVRNIRAQEQLSNGESIVSFTWSTDDLTINTLSYRIQERLASFSTKHETVASKEHSFSLPLSLGKYEFFVTSQNTSGLKTVEDNDGKYYQAEVLGNIISPHGFVQTSIGIPPMHVGSVTSDFDRDGRPEILGLPLTGDAVSGVRIYERTLAGNYTLEHTSALAFRPWAVDDTDGDGLLEILGSTTNKTFLIESLTHNGYPEQITWEVPFLSAGQIADLDGDGRKEIIGADNNNEVIRIFENHGNNVYKETATLKNETGGTNVFGEQMGVGDFDGDGKMELLVGDSESELLVYEATGNNQFTETWRTQLDGFDVHQQAVGDLTGEGIPEFILGRRLSNENASPAIPHWKFTVFSTDGDNHYFALWSQEIVPFRPRGNSLAIGNVIGKAQSELVIFANPNVYVFNYDGIGFTPIWHHKAWDTPRLLLADLNEDGFDEIVLNTQESLNSFHQPRVASRNNTLLSRQPWGLLANPLTKNLVQLTWRAVDSTGSVNIYRAVHATGKEKEEIPPEPSAFQQIGQSLNNSKYVDRGVTKDTTYWYAISAMDGNGIETERTEAVSVTPQSPPRITTAEYLGRNQIAVIFDKQMGHSICNERHYLLRRPGYISGVLPQSAIRDRMGTRAILTFRTGDLMPNRTYEITVSVVQDVNRNPINPRASGQLFHVPSGNHTAQPTDFRETLVYPNPIRPNAYHKAAVTFDRVPKNTNIHIYDANGSLLEHLTVTAADGGRKDWWLLSNNISEVTSGLYIYVMELGNLTKTGKIAVIK